MANADRDSNQVVVMLAENPSGAPAVVKIDHTTGYVLVAVTTVADIVPIYTPDHALHDANDVPSLIAQNPTGDVQALLIDDSNPGNLWIDQE